MNKLMTTVLAAACGIACIAQEVSAQAPKADGSKIDAQRAERLQRARMERRPHMMRGMRGGIEARPFGKLADGKETTIYRLKGLGGIILDITDYGGRLVRCYAPDKYGNLADVTLGWNTPGEYETLGFSMGTLIGRYGNRIADGKFKLDGQEYQLPINEDKKTETTQRHCNLHGGPEGWDKKVWKARPLRMGPVQGLELTYVSKDGEMGFPGTVTCKVTYKVLPNNVWTELQIFADEYTQTTPGLIPTKNAPVKGTGFDFTELRPIGAKADLMKADKSLAAMDNWYDHNFVLRGEAGKLKQAVKMRDPASGRTMEIWTTEPCMQMYGAQNMTDAVPAKAAGRHLCQFAGVALETQHAPDSPNRSDFPSTVLKPGDTFKSHTEYRFGVEK